MNTRRIKAVLRHIQKHPESFDMWEAISECRTVGCFAGHAVLKFGGKTRLPGLGNIDRWAIIRQRAERLLGLDERQSRRLFFVNEWRGFGYRYSIAQFSRDRVAALAERVEHFLKTKGAE